MLNLSHVAWTHKLWQTEWEKDGSKLNVIFKATTLGISLSLALRSIFFFFPSRFHFRTFSFRDAARSHLCTSPQHPTLSGRWSTTHIFLLSVIVIIATRGRILNGWPRSKMETCILHVYRTPITVWVSRLTFLRGSWSPAGPWQRPWRCWAGRGWGCSRSWPSGPSAQRGRSQPLCCRRLLPTVRKSGLLFIPGFGTDISSAFSVYLELFSSPLSRYTPKCLNFVLSKVLGK